MRGGIKEAIQPENGGQALLRALWDRFGGPSIIAERVSQVTHSVIDSQVPVNWRIRGRVPSKYVKAVAQALNISPLGLNYAVLSALTYNVPGWDEVVLSYGLPKEVTDSILMLKPPSIEE